MLLFQIEKNKYDEISSGLKIDLTISSQTTPSYHKRAYSVHSKNWTLMMTSKSNGDKTILVSRCQIWLSKL